MNWTIYRDSTKAWEEMLNACRNAEKSIDLEQFIFIPDDIGKKFITICEEKAKQGVKVRFLWDAAGSFSFFGSSMIEDLKKKGVHLRFFKTLIPRSVWNHRLWFFRNHRRSLIIDKKFAFTGSASIWDDTHDWTETHIKISGNIVKQISQSFEQMWIRSGVKTYRWKKEPPTLFEDFSYITNSPLRKMRFLYKNIFDSIEKAQKNISITTPYFCPDKTMLKALLKARDRGVDIDIILPEESDHFLVDIGGYSFFTQLLKKGIKIYLYQKGMLHSKSIIVDQKWATIGTLNFDNVSLRYNFEANIVSSNLDFINELEMFFIQDKKDSREMTFDTWKKRSTLQKVLELLIKPFRPLL